MSSNIVTSNIVDRQTIVLSVNLNTMTGAVPSKISIPLNLRFAADVVDVKSILYANPQYGATPDIQDIIQLWTNITVDGLIGAFSNAGPNAITASSERIQHFRLNNTFQTGNMEIQFQSTDLGGPASINPQSLISLQNPQRSFGTVVISLQFIKLLNKDFFIN